MPKFIYEAIDENGHSVRGDLQAPDVASAIASLQSKGLSVEMIRAEPTVEPAASPTTNSEFYKNVQSAIDQRHLMIPPLVALADEFNLSANERELRGLVSMLQREPSGTAWLNNEQAMGWLPLIISGARTDQNRMSRLFRRAMNHRTPRWYRSPSLIYPLVVLTLAVAIIVGLGTLIIPTFDQMFRDFHLHLPAPTAITLWVSSQIVDHALRTLGVVLLTVVSMIVITRWILRHALGSRFLGGLVAGNAMSVQAMSRLTEALAEMLSIGATLPEALRIAGKSCGHYQYCLVLEELASCAESKHPLAQHHAATWFPVNVLDALQPANGSPPNCSLLRELSVIYEARFNQRVDWVQWFIGPVAIITVGFVVGFVVISLFMPMVSMISSLS